IWRGVQLGGAVEARFPNSMVLAQPNAPCIIFLALWLVGFSGGAPAAFPVQHTTAESATLLVERGQYDEAIALFESAVNRVPNDVGLAEKLAAAYVAKWQALLKRSDFDAQIGAIRADILKLLQSGSSETVLGTARRGYEFLGDGDARLKVEERILSE